MLGIMPYVQSMLGGPAQEMTIFLNVFFVFFLCKNLLTWVQLRYIKKVNKKIDPLHPFLPLYAVFLGNQSRNIY